MIQDTETVYDEEFQAKVFKSFLRDGLILAMPADRKMRRVLLDYMVNDLAFGRPYTELEVNFRILDHYDEYNAVRREMVAEGLLKKDKGAYYRVQPSENSEA